MTYFLQRLPKARMRDREGYLCEVSRGRSVLHLGCADSELLSRRIERDELLHSRLATAAASIAGVDIDASAIEVLRGLGYEDLHVGSAEQLQSIPSLSDRTFDVVVAGEIIEHLRNPGLFLDGVRSLLSDGGTLVVTTPNGLRSADVLPTIAGVELNHPNHVLSFTPVSLAHLLESSGYTVERIDVYRVAEHVDVRKGGVGERALRLVYAIADHVVWNPVVMSAVPYSADGLIVTASLAQAAASEPQGSQERGRVG